MMETLRFNNVIDATKAILRNGSVGSIMKPTPNFDVEYTVFNKISEAVSNVKIR